MQASWNQWSGPVNNYAATSYPNSFPNVPNVPPAASFPVPPAAAPVGNPPIGTQFPNVYGAQPTQTTQQQWQQWEQWQQQYAQWQQQYGDKYQGSVPTQGMMPTSFPTMPPLPPSAPSAQPPPPDSMPPVDKDESNKRPHEGTSNEDTKKQKTGKGKQETLESLIESEKVFDQQFKSWESSFLTWKEQNVNHPDKTQYKEYEAKCESYREQLLQKRESLRKKREAKEAEVAAAAAAAKEAALATSSTATAQQTGYSSTTAPQNAPYMAPPSMMYPPMPAVMPNQPGNAYMPNYPLYSMPPPLGLPSLSGPPPLGEDPTKKNSQPLEFLCGTAMSGAKSIPGLDLVSSDKNPSSNFAPNIPPSSALFSTYNRDLTKPLHTSEDKPFNFPRPAQPNFGNNSAENQYSYPGGRPNFENDSRMNHSSRNVPFSQFDRPNHLRDGNSRFDRPNQPRDGNPQFDRPNLVRDGNPQFDRPNQLRDGNSQFDRPNLMRDGPPPFDRGNQMRDGNSQFDRLGQMREGNSQFDRPQQLREGNDRFKNQTSYPSNEYGDRGDYQYRKNESDMNYRNNDRSKFGGNSSSFAFTSDKYAKYLEDEYDDSRFRDPEPEDDFSSRKSDYQRDQSYRNNNFQGRQNYRNDSGSFFGRNRGGDRDFNDRNFKGDFNNRDDGRAMFQDRNKESANFGNFNRDGNRFGGGRGFGRPSFGRDGSDCKEPLNKFDNIEKDAIADPSRPISLLDLPMMKPPDTFDKSQPPPMKPPETFDSKFPPPIMKPIDPLDKNIRNLNVPETENNLPHMNEPPKLFNTADNKNIPLRQEEEKPKIIEQAMLIEPFVASQIFEYNHVLNNSEDIVSFEPVWVFDYSHGKKKTLDTFDLKPKSDEVTELTPKPDNLFKKDNSWDGDSWDENEKKINQTPLPERIRNVPFTNRIRNDERNSNTSVSLLDGRELSEDKNSTNDAKENSWLREKKPLMRVEEKPPTLPIDELILPPGRNIRPSKIVIIMRGPPGSGKTYTAKLIKDKELEMGASAPRILSLDDYFAMEDLESGESNGDAEIGSSGTKYNYDAALEPSYLDSLVKSFKKNITDGFFPFIIVDCINDKLKKYEEMYNFAKLKGFQVYICEMERDIDSCKKQNIHARTEEDMLKIIKEWESTPSTQTVLDIQNFLKSSTVTEESNETPADEQDTNKIVEENADISEDNCGKENTNTLEDTKTEDQSSPVSEEKKEAEEYSSYMEVLCSSKWENMEQTEEKLARLDGVNRKRSTSFKEWLQLPEERDISWYAAMAAESAGDASISKKKRVRWADLEERVAQQKMREIGFVVGHTDWKRMMDPSFGGNALTQTKYI